MVKFGLESTSKSIDKGKPLIGLMLKSEMI